MIEKYRIVPVVVIKEIEDTLSTLKALCDGGLPIAEITFRTDCAKDAIALGVKAFPKMLIGAGTIINGKQCLGAIQAGAKFIVSPGFSQDVLNVCRENNVPYYPGCATPTEIMQAIDGGLDVIKFFPANVYGGLKAIKALSAPFPQVKFLPTGGIDDSNLSEFLNFEKIVAVGGSWMMKGSFDEIEKKTRSAMEIVKEYIK